MKNLKFWILVITASMFSFKALAQTEQDNRRTELEKLKKHNQFTLVYENAIKENVQGKVNIHPVSYKLHNIDIAANVYTPANFNPSKKYAAIVVAHPNGGVKEQVAGYYAQLLAEQGYVTIAADASYQGGSGGFPRNVDRPSNRMEDIRGMADYISNYKGVDENKIGLLGVCGGAGYAIKTAQTDKRFKAVTTLSLLNSGSMRRNGLKNSQISTIQERLNQASEARALEAKTGEVRYSSPLAPDITDEEADKLPFQLNRQMYYYYYKTHKHPNSTFRYTMSSLLDLASFDVNTNMDLLTQPLLMIAGSNADTYYMTDEIFKNVTNSKEKEFYIIDGATHIETYWKEPYVSQALQKMTLFFDKNL